MRAFRTILWINAIALTFPLQGLLLRMLSCWPAGTLEHGESAPIISNSGFFMDPTGLLAAVSYPEPREVFSASYIHTLFGGSDQCYTTHHLVHVIVAIATYLLHCGMCLCTIAFTGERHHSGAELHFLNGPSLRRRPGTSLFLVWDLYFDFGNVNSSVLLMSVVGDFLGRRVLGVMSTLFVLVLGGLYSFGASIRDRNFETLVFASVIALSTTTFIATVASFVGDEANVDLSASVLILPWAGLLIGIVISRARQNWAITVDSTALRWTAPTLHWVNTRTRWAAQAFLSSSRAIHVKRATRHSSTCTPNADTWSSHWISSGDTRASNSGIGACRLALRRITTECRVVLQQLISRYPHSAMPHLAAAEYLSSPVVTTTQQARMEHLAIAWKLAAGAPWHRIQCWQHLQVMRSVHISVLSAALLSRQAQFDKELAVFAFAAAQVHSVRANVIQLAAAAGVADTALLSSVSVGTQQVHSICAEVMTLLHKYKQDNVVYEKLLRGFVQLLGSHSVDFAKEGDRHLQQLEAQASWGSLGPQTLMQHSSDVSSPSYRHQPFSSASGTKWRPDAHEEEMPAVSICSISHDSHFSRGAGFALSPSMASQQLSFGIGAVQRSSAQRGGASPLFGHGWLACRPNEVVLHQFGTLSGNSKLPFISRCLMHACEQAGQAERLQFGQLPGVRLNGESTEAGVSATASGFNTSLTVGNLAQFYLTCGESSHGYNDVGSFSLSGASRGMLELLGISPYQVHSLKLADVLNVHLPRQSISRACSIGSLGKHTEHVSPLSGLTEGCTLSLTALRRQVVSAKDNTAYDTLLANAIAIPSWCTGDPLPLGQLSSDAGNVAAIGLFQRPQYMWLVIIEPLYTPHSVGAPSCAISLSSVTKTARRASSCGSTSNLLGLLSKGFPQTNAPSFGQLPISTPVKPHNSTVQLHKPIVSAGFGPQSQLSAAGTSAQRFHRAPLDGMSWHEGSRTPAEQSGKHTPQKRSVMSHSMISSHTRGSVSEAGTCDASKAKATVHLQDTIRQQLQHKVQHDRYSSRILVTIWINIIGLFVYGMYIVYLVLATGNNPLIALRFRQPTVLSQLQNAPLAISLWTQALDALDQGASNTTGFASIGAAQGGLLFEQARYGLTTALRETGEGAAQKLASALQDASSLDAFGGGPPGALTHQWTEAVDSSNIALSTVTAVQASLESALTATLHVDHMHDAQRMQPATTVAAALNATSHLAVRLLNDSFARTWGVRTFPAIALLVFFVAATFIATAKAEKQLVVQAVSALDDTVCAAERITAKYGPQGELSPSMARRHLHLKLQRTVGAWCSMLGLKHELTLKVVCIITFVVGLIGIGFVSRYAPEDTQARVVNAGYAAQQLQAASWNLHLQLDTKLWQLASSTPPSAGGPDTTEAFSKATHWRRVLFGLEPAGFMVSAAPGGETRALFAADTAGDTMLFHNACISISAGSAAGANAQYAPARDSRATLTNNLHSSQCNSIADGVLSSGWQAATFSMLGESLDLHRRVDGWTAQQLPSGCAAAVRAATWVVLGRTLACARPFQGCAAHSAGSILLSLQGVVNATCGQLGASQQAALEAAALVEKAVRVLQLQAVHFEAVADAAIVLGADSYSASLATYARETLLPVGSVPFVLLAFLYFVGGPSALRKRRLIHSSQLMSSLVAGLSTQR